MEAQIQIRKKASNSFLIVVLISAALLTAVRFLHVADLGYDLTLQIQAAQLLLDGKGLSIYTTEPLNGDDLGQPLKLVGLTHFPCGYSLYAAALIALGLDLGLVLKLFGALLTMAGWWGWGRLAALFMMDGLDRNVFWKACGFTIAITLPVFFTPPWNGTDIFLWAFIPWTVHWLSQAAKDSSWRGPWIFGLVGAASGLCVLMRYASLFLVAGCLLLVIGQSLGRWMLQAKRLAIFIGGLASVLWVQWSVMHQLGSPGGISLDAKLETAVRSGIDGVRFLNSVNHAFFFWAPRHVHASLTSPIDSIPWQLSIAAIAFVLPYIVAWKCNARDVAGAFSDPRVAATLFIPVLALVLWGCMFLGSYNYLSDLRYYWPVVPLTVFIAWFLAVPQEKSSGKMIRLLQGTSLVFVLAVLLTGVIRLVSLFQPGAYGDAQREMLVGAKARVPWPCMRVEYEDHEARRYVVDYLRRHPETFLLTGYEPWFYADRSLDRSRIIRLLFFDRWPRVHVAGPARLLFMVRDYGEPEQIVWGWQGDRPSVFSLHHFPRVKVLERFPDWRIKVVEAVVPTGARIPIDESKS